MKGSASRSERFEVWITKSQKALFMKAARMQGRSLTDFMIASVQEAAERALNIRHLLKLSERDRKSFVMAVLKAGPPGKALRQAASRYKATGRRVNTNQRFPHPDR